jgi:hypothetical protein
MSHVLEQKFVMRYSALGYIGLAKARRRCKLGDWESTGVSSQDYNKTLNVSYKITHLLYLVRGCNLTSGIFRVSRKIW